MTGEQHARANEIAEELRALNGHISFAHIQQDMHENISSDRMLMNIASKYLPNDFFFEYISKMESRISVLQNEFAKL